MMVTREVAVGNKRVDKTARGGSRQQLSQGGRKAEAEGEEMTHQLTTMMTMTTMTMTMRRSTMMMTMTMMATAMATTMVVATTTTTTQQSNSVQE